MVYKPSPRPTFTGPTHIRYQEVTRHLWGDTGSGQIADWIYASTEQVHQLVFGIQPGEGFRHSEDQRTIFGADEVFHVLQGELVLANPETGEVHRIRSGESAFFRRDTWHHGFNYGQEPLRVLEYVAPPPLTGTGGHYGQQQENLTAWRYTPDRWMGRWPMARAQARQESAIQVLREEDILWRLEGDDLDRQILVGIIASTEHFTVGRVELRPGQESDTLRHPGQKVLYLKEGALNVYLPEYEEQKWYELSPGDGFFLPQETPHQYHNIHRDPVRFTFMVAPEYE